MSATPTQIKDRLVLICAALSGVVAAYDDWPEDNQPFAAAEMPCFIVQVGPATLERADASRFSMRREFRLLLLVARTEEDIANPDTSAGEAVEPFLLSVPRHFRARSRLEHNDNGLSVSTSLPNDNGIQRIVRNSGVYTVAVFTLTATTMHS